MKMNLGKLLLAISMPLFFFACKKDHGEDHDEEVITTLTVKLTPQTGGATLSFSFDDPDGPGGAAPTIAPIVLAPNTIYNVSLELYNKTTNPVTNLTTEISAESNAHRFYYAPSAGSNITVSNLNNDVNGIPFGLTSTWTTGAPSQGTMKITLRHYGGNPPNKAADDPVTSNKSSTDAEVTFNTTILQ
jgi:hypothetical protein